MTQELEGKVAVVTGGARGIGRAICRALGQAGAAVVVNYFSSEAHARELVKELTGFTKAMALRADVSNPTEVEHLYRATIETFGRVDILVNNASYSSKTSWRVSLDGLSVEEWERTIAVDLKGTLLCCKVFGPAMVRQGGGKIINFSSSAALQGDASTMLYGAAKVGIVGLTTALARLLAPRVRVNAIAPGSVRTDWITDWGLQEGDLQEILTEIPLHRMAEPEEIAQAVLFLASAGGDYITGQTLVVNGGVFMR
jgi:3-oxoacyl-[acyl-carrier protein] reductase